MKPRHVDLVGWERTCTHKLFIDESTWFILSADRYCIVLGVVGSVRPRLRDIYQTLSENGCFRESQVGVVWMRGDRRYFFPHG